MTKSSKKPRKVSNKPKQKPKPPIEDNQPQLPPNLQTFKQKILSRSGFVEKKWFF